MAVLACLALPSIAAAQPGRGAVDAGNRLYDEGRYEEAHEQYLEALRQAPDSPIVPFNDGNALYRTEELQRAMESYRRAVESGDPRIEAQAWYNLGNALYKQQQLEPALEAYKEALRRNPADTDAKHNFEVTLEQLQQQQQQESDDQQDENDEGRDQQDRPQSEQEQDQEQQDQPEDQEPPEQQQDQPQEQQQENVEQPPPPGALSREEAERLLQAIDEDPSQIQRQRQTTAPARPPRRPW
ncbi:MAG: tetratricopeptide repeat protein [Vicinamibacterales bacterium]|nr:tetratricopeptide repeat protein [Vicinamibacterales bacterium]